MKRAGLILFVVGTLIGLSVADNMTERLDYPEYWFQEGVSELLLNHYDRALYLLETALSQDPTLAGAWYWKGVTLEELGRGAEAKQSFAKAEEIDPLIRDPYRKKVGALADYTVTPVPTARPVSSDDEDEMITEDIDLSKQPDPTGPDIIITALDASIREADQALAISFSLANEGFKPTRDFYVTFYASTDSSITTDDTAIGYYLIPNLLEGTADDYTGYIPLAKIPPGEWYIGALADPTNTVMEVSEKNNARSLSQKITIPDVTDPTLRTTPETSQLVLEKKSESKPVTVTRPNLAVTRVESWTAAAPGETIPVNTTIKNDGETDAASFIVTIYLSKDALISDDDHILGEGRIDDLGAGLAREGSAGILVPEDISPGTYYLGVLADSGFEITEIDETDNMRFSETGALKITSPGESGISGEASPVPAESQVPASEPQAGSEMLPDLVVQDITSDTTATPGGTIAVNTTVKNAGPGDAGTFMVSLLLSKDGNITAEDILIGLGEITDLPAGLIRNGTATAPIPANLTPGEYYFGIIADSGNMVEELNEDNNAGAGPVPIRIA